MRFKFERYWFPRFGAFMLNRSMSNTLYNIQQIYNASFIMFSRHKNIFTILFLYLKLFLITNVKEYFVQHFIDLSFIGFKKWPYQFIYNPYWYFFLFPVCRFVCIQLTSKWLNRSDSLFFCGNSHDPRKDPLFLITFFAEKKNTEKQRKEWIQSLKL